MKTGTRRRRAITVALLSALMVLVPVVASAATGRVTLEVPNASGTQFGFDVESASLSPATAASTDVRTHTHTVVGHRQLVALNGASVAKLATTDFASVHCSMMRNASFSTSIFTGVDGTTDPVPGTIYVVRSRVDGYAKMQLVSVKDTAPKGLVLDFETTLCPLDTTPPVITPSVTGNEGLAGWFTGPVEIDWTVSDGESDIISSEGCEPVTLTDDTEGTTLVCVATSAGGSASAPVTVSIDQTAPVVAYEGNRNVYELDEHVTIHCVATDETSGVASDTCVSIDAPAHELGHGEHHASAEAHDVAGNHGTGATSFEVVITPGGVARLTIKLVADGDLASLLQKRADQVWSAPNAEARDGAVTSFENLVAAKTGKGIDEAAALVLVRVVSLL